MTQNELEMNIIQSEWENLTNIQKKEVSDRTDLLINCFKSSSSFSINFKYFLDQHNQEDRHLGNEALVFKNMINCLFFKLLETDAQHHV